MTSLLETENLFNYKIDDMAESEEESFTSGASGSAECRGTLCISSVTHSSCQAPCSSMTPCATVEQGIFIKNKKIVPDFKNNNLLYIRLYLKIKKIYNIIFILWNYF